MQQFNVYDAPRPGVVVGSQASPKLRDSKLPKMVISDSVDHGVKKVRKASCSRYLKLPKQVDLTLIDYGSNNSPLGLLKDPLPHFCCSRFDVIVQ